MKIRTALRQGLQAYGQHVGELLQGTLLQVVLRLIVAAPLLFLSNDDTALFALLTPVLFLLLVLPLRQNAAQGMQSLLGGGRYLTPELLSFAGYGHKLTQGLKSALLLLLWGLPCIAATAALVGAYLGMVDVFTLMRFFMALGNGKFTTGVLVGMGIYALTFLPLLLGMALESWRRHGSSLGLNAKAMRGARLRLLGVQLVSALTLLPFLAVTVFICQGYVSQLLQAVSGLASGQVSLPPLTGNVGWVAVAFVALFLPLLPLKNLLPAAFLRGVAENAKKDVAA